MTNVKTTDPKMEEKIGDAAQAASVASDSQSLPDSPVAQNSIHSAPATNTLRICKPLGHVSAASLISGLAGSVVAAVLDLIHIFDSLFNSIQTSYTSKPFYLEDAETWHKSLDWMIAFLLGWAVAYVVLDTVGKGKRVFIGAVALVLIAMFSPLLMLWGVLWIPIVEVVAVSFTLICAFIYTSQHVMPCELGTRMRKVKQPKPVKPTTKKNSEADSSSNGFEPMDSEKTSANTVENTTDAST